MATRDGGRIGTTLRRKIAAASPRAARRRDVPDVVPPAPSRLAFVHLPKCGGTSVDAALRSALDVPSLDGWIDPAVSRAEAAAAVGSAPELAVPRWLDHRAYLLWHYLSERRPAVSGHAPVTRHVLDRFAQDTPFVTVLRDPVDRWISYYRFSKLTSEDPNVVPNRLADRCAEDELDDVLGSASGRYIGSFYAIHLGGHRPYSTDDPHDAVGTALLALDRFAVVGFTSDWDGFADSCAGVLGVRPVIPHLNDTAAYTPETAEPDPLSSLEARDRIAELCEADLEIYRAARRRFGASVPAGA